jgi:hypothetical protein
MTLSLESNLDGDTNSLGFDTYDEIAYGACWGMRFEEAAGNSMLKWGNSGFDCLLITGKFHPSVACHACLEVVIREAFASQTLCRASGCMADPIVVYAEGKHTPCS